MLYYFWTFLSVKYSLEPSILITFNNNLMKQNILKKPFNFVSWTCSDLISFHKRKNRIIKLSFCSWEMDNTVTAVQNSTNKKDTFFDCLHIFCNIKFFTHTLVVQKITTKTQRINAIEALTVLRCALLFCYEAKTFFSLNSRRYRYSRRYSCWIFWNNLINAQSTVRK